ncbi:hypothetical protein [Hyalangium gracile]|uniref:hypothetical protein n=1 Tax=Hyalangium gracile TaxID=394092 RepID=UPI001CCFCE81|nr:hypothetical protein [Hyalangium gracile]
MASEPVPAEPTVPAGELIPYHYKPEHEAPPDLVLPRVLAEAFGGVLGGVGMGIVGLLAGASALESVDCSDGETVCAATVLVVTVPAILVGIPLGVQMAGENFGGQGRFLPALAGTVLGAGLGLMYGLTSDGSGDLALGLIVGPVLGSILFYEISHAVVRNGGFPVGGVSSAKKGPRVVPVVGATPRGGLLGGLSGTF